VKPYWEVDGIALYLGDCREVLPALGITCDLIVADPPYAETSLAWDRWPDGWPTIAATVSSSMWCFGSMRMFLDRRDEFAAWKLSQDVVWDKGRGSSTRADRFKRVHEQVAYWYRGDWASRYHAAQRERYYGPNQGRPRGVNRGEHLNRHRSEPYVDDGTRLLTSVRRVPNLTGRAVHPTEKPVGVLAPLIEYACPPGGLIVDPFAGSGSTLEAARLTGREAIGIEAHESYAEAAARRLAQAPLEAL
jgi:site-specific DNA-methyltransferase (adenine-specific)